MKIKEELLKFDMANVFYAISVIYGPHRYTDFCNYIKDIYDLDPSYKPGYTFVDLRICGR